MQKQWSKSESIEQRLIRNVHKTESCWVWLGCKNAYGYGVMAYKMKRQLAHRWAYQIFNGPLKKGLGVLHKCHNPSCVNPRHLYLGNQKQNMRDCVLASRQNRGFKNGQAKLTEDKVKQILFLLKTRQFLDREIAMEFEINRGTVNSIKLGKRWGFISRENL